jgi:hypothetical protein
MDSRRRNAIVTLAVAITVLLLGAQVAIPAYVSSRVEDRLTAHGGSAHVTVRALPALSLIHGAGQSIDVTGRNLKLDVPRSTALGKLDGFDRVHVDITNATAGPFAVHRLQLDRATRGESYRVVLDAVARPSDLTKYAVTRVEDNPLSDLIGGFAADLLPVPDDPTRIRLSAVLRSDGGAPRVVAVQGGVGGLNAGPVAADLLGAFASRL